MDPKVAYFFGWHRHPQSIIKWSILDIHSFHYTLLNGTLNYRLLAPKMCVQRRQVNSVRAMMANLKLHNTRTKHTNSVHLVTATDDVVCPTNPNINTLFSVLATFKS